MTIDVGVILPTAAGWDEVLGLARFAQDVGAGSVWLPDHAHDGALEAWTAATVVAARFETVQVGVHALVPSFRTPALVARMASSLDTLVPGRVRVLVSSGGNRSSYDALGCPYPAPGERLVHMRETVSALGAAGIAVDVAGTQDDVLRLAADHAAGWSLSPNALDTFFERVGALRKTCASLDRPFQDLRVSTTMFCAVGDDEATADPSHSSWAPRLGLVGSAEQAVQRAADLAAQGLREIQVGLPAGERGRRCLELLMREVVPRLG